MEGEFTMGPPGFAPLGRKAENTWTEPLASEFLVRGPDYLKQQETNVIGLKQPSKEAPYKCIGVNVFKSTVSLEHSSLKIAECRKFLEAQLDDSEEEKGGMPQFLVICWMFSSFLGYEHTLVHHLFKRTAAPKGEDEALDHAMSRFLSSNAEGKSSQLKYMFKVVEAPPTMISAVSSLGGERPVIIGKRLTTKYHSGKNYLEIDMDVGSSTVASMLNSTILGTCASAIIDVCWLIEGQRANELPERVLAKARWNYCNPGMLYVTINEKGERI